MTDLIATLEGLTGPELRYLRKLVSFGDEGMLCRGSEWSSPTMQALRGLDLVTYRASSHKYRRVTLTNAGRALLRAKEAKEAKDDL